MMKYETPVIEHVLLADEDVLTLSLANAGYGDSLDYTELWK